MVNHKPQPTIAPLCRYDGALTLSGGTNAVETEVFSNEKNDGSEVLEKPWTFEMRDNGQRASAWNPTQGDSSVDSGTWSIQAMIGVVNRSSGNMMHHGSRD